MRRRARVELVRAGSVRPVAPLACGCPAGGTAGTGRREARRMDPVDFANSYMTFFGHDQGNIARIQLDAACTMVDERAGTSRTYYLIAPCRAERMYLDGNLFQMPNYEFCGIFSREECLLLRTHWVSERDNREYARNTERFAEVRLDVRNFSRTRRLADPA